MTRSKKICAFIEAYCQFLEGAHREIENILQRMREVSVQAANDTNNNQDRNNLQAEMDSMIAEIDRIACTTTWAGAKLMESGSGLNFYCRSARPLTNKPLGVLYLGFKATKYRR